MCGVWGPCRVGRLPWHHVSCRRAQAVARLASRSNQNVNHVLSPALVTYTHTRALAHTYTTSSFTTTHHLHLLSPNHTSCQLDATVEGGTTTGSGRGSSTLRLAGLGAAVRDAAVCGALFQGGRQKARHDQCHQLHDTHKAERCVLMARHVRLDAKRPRLACESRAERSRQRSDALRDAVHSA